MELPAALLLAPALVLGSVAYRAPNELPALRVDTVPVIDGIVDPEEWAGIPSAGGFVDERTGAPAPEATTFWLAYDDRYVYFAAVMQDSEPHRIVATQYRTNVSLGGDDKIELRLDPTGRNQNFSRFSINPRGATNIQIAGGRAGKREWTGEFVAAARITETGWEAEARIPWELMSLPAPGVRTIRFNLERRIGRLQRDYHWVFTGDGQRENMGRWLDVEVPVVPLDRSIKLLPYGYAGVDRNGHILNLGLDLKTRLADRIDFAGSINPDFRNIENQILSLDFSYFERLAGESRPFFEEGSDFFPGSRGTRIFASQRIASFDVGAKAFGQIDDRTGFGLLNTVDFGNRMTTVGQVQHQYRPDSTATFAFADDTRTDGLGSTAFAAMVSHREGPFNFFGSRMQTRDAKRGHGYRTNVGTWYGRSGWGGFVDYTEVSPGFFPRLGFAPESNYRGYEYSLSRYDQYPNGPLQSTNFRVGGNRFDRFDGSRYRRRWFAEAGATWRDLDLGLNYSQSLFLDFDDRLLSGGASWPRGNPNFRLNVEGAAGRQGGADYRTTRVSTFYRPHDRWTVNLSHQMLWYTQNRQQTILSSNYDLGDDASISGRMVRRNNDINWYLAYRKSGNVGTEYFLILGDPNSQTFRASLILKVVTPLEFRP